MSATLAQSTIDSRLSRKDLATKGTLNGPHKTHQLQHGALSMDPFYYISGGLSALLLLSLMVKAVWGFQRKLKVEHAQLQSETFLESTLESILFHSQSTLTDVQTDEWGSQGTFVHSHHTMAVDINSENPGEGTDEETAYNFTLKLTELNAEVPSWFSCTIGPERFALNMGIYKIETTRYALLHTFPSEVRHLLDRFEQAALHIKGVDVMLTGTLHVDDYTRDFNFTYGAATFPSVMREFIKSLSNTSKKMEKRFLTRIQDPFILTQFYVQRMIHGQEIVKARKFLLHMLDTSKDHDLLVHLCALLVENSHLKWTEGLIRKIIARTADPKLLSKVLGLPPFLNMLTTVNVNTKRAVELLHTMHKMALHDEPAAHALMNQINPQHLTHKVIKASPDIVSALIVHLSSTDWPREEVAKAYDRAVHIMTPHDAASLIKMFARDTPELCTCERFDAALKVDKVMMERKHLYAAVNMLRLQDPTRFAEPRWLAHMIELSEHAPEEDADAILDLITRYAQPEHYESLHHLATLRLHRGHPLRTSLTAVLESIKQRFASGALSLSDPTMSGQLTGVATQKGELKVKE